MNKKLFNDLTLIQKIIISVIEKKFMKCKTIAIHN